MSVNQILAGHMAKTCELVRAKNVLSILDEAKQAVDFCWAPRAQGIFPCRELEALGSCPFRRQTWP